MIQSILIIKLASLGDILQLTPLIKHLRHYLPNVKIDWMVNGSYQHLITSNPEIRNVIPIQSIWQAGLATLRRWRHYDAVVVLHRNPLLSLLAGLTGAKYRIGFHNTLDKVLTHSNTFDLAIPRLNRYMNLLEPLGIPTFPVTAALSFTPDRSKSLAAADILAQLGPPHPFIVLAPAGGKNAYSEMPSRRWPYFKTLITHLRKQAPNHKLLLVGGKDERAGIEEVVGKQDHHILNAAGLLNSHDLGIVLQSAALFIGNDSFPLFMACSQNVPSIGLFGPTDASLIMPNTSNAYSLQSDIFCSPCYDPIHHQKSLAYHCPYTYKCMRTLSPEAVLKKALDILEAKKPDA